MWKIWDFRIPVAFAEQLVSEWESYTCTVIHRVNNQTLILTRIPHFMLNKLLSYFSTSRKYLKVYHLKSIKFLSVSSMSVVYLADV